MTKPFHINKPCSENWENMSQTEQGRHCEKCSLTVMDFTSMSDEEVLSVLQNRRGERTCGRIRKKIEAINLPEVLISDRRNSFHVQSASRLFTFSMCALLLAACQNSPNAGTKEEKADSAVVQVDSHLAPLDTPVVAAGAIDSVKHHPIPPEPEPYIEIIGDIEIDPSFEEPVMPPPEPDFSKLKNGEDTVFMPAVDPKFPGGMDSLMQFIKSNLEYPKRCMDAGIEGRVYARIAISKDGNVENAHILRSVQAAPEFDVEVLRVLAMMPKWEPGKDGNGKPAHVWFTIQFLFKLSS